MQILSVFFRTCESKSDLTRIFLQIYEENMLRHENILKFVAADNLGWTSFLRNYFKYFENILTKLYVYLEKLKRGVKKKINF